MELLKDFLDSIKSIINGSADIFTYVTLVVCIGTAITIIVFKYLKVRKQEKLRKDLHPYFDDENILLAKKYYIGTQCQDRPPEIDSEINESSEVANKSNLINFFNEQVFNTTKQRFYLILGDAGMGKTTFMLNLFLKYNSGLFPKNYDMKYIPLSYPDADERISELKPLDKSTILLLDGFDEDPKAVINWEQRIHDIILKVQNFRKVIITCRTQFFPNEEKIPYQLEILRLGLNGGVHTLNKKHISPFTDREVRKYLNKKYGHSIVIDDKWFYYNQRRVKANAIVNMAPTLSVRPMLLDKIDELVLSNRKLEYDYEVFEELVLLWIDRESKKQITSIKNNFKKHMYDFLIYAAIKVYKNFRQGEGLFISIEQIENIAMDQNIQLTIVDMKSRSLLNLNPDGRIKFSHKTILEYFLALVDAEKIEPERINFNSFTYAIKLRVQILKSRLAQLYRVILISPDGIFFRQMKMSSESVNYVEAIMLETRPNNKLHYFRLFPSLKVIYILSEIGNPSLEKNFEISKRTVKEPVYPFNERNVPILKINGETYHVQISQLQMKVINAHCYDITLGAIWA